MKSTKTPPSLKWLITNKARLLGELEKLTAREESDINDSYKKLKHAERDLDLKVKNHEYAKLMKDLIIPRIKAEINALDTALLMHKVQFNHDLISSVRTQESKRILAHGSITKSIYEFLKITGRPSTPTEVTLYIINRYKLDIPDDQFFVFRRTIKSRLCNLTWQGKLARTHAAKTTIEGKWTLLKSDAE